MQYAEWKHTSGLCLHRHANLPSSRCQPVPVALTPPPGPERKPGQVLAPPCRSACTAAPVMQKTSALADRPHCLPSLPTRSKGQLQLMCHWYRQGTCIIRQQSPMTLGHANAAESSLMLHLQQCPSMHRTGYATAIQFQQAAVVDTELNRIIW